MFGNSVRCVSLHATALEYYVQRECGRLIALSCPNWWKVFRPLIRPPEYRCCEHSWSVSGTAIFKRFLNAFKSFDLSLDSHITHSEMYVKLCPLDLLTGWSILYVKQKYEINGQGIKGLYIKLDFVLFE